MWSLGRGLGGGAGGGALLIVAERVAGPGELGGSSTTVTSRGRDSAALSSAGPGC